MDAITDMLNRIRNAQMVYKKTVDVPFSNINFKMANILKNEGFLAEVKKRGKNPFQIIRISLSYRQDKSPTISGFRRVSKPGQRIYKKASDIKAVKNGYGISIVSTTKGLMTDREARKENAGGELMIEVW